MKKYLAVIGMTLCLIGLTACGKSDDTKSYMTNDEALALGTQAASHISGVVSQGMEEANVANINYQGGDGTVYANAYESFKKAKTDIGEFNGVGELISNDMEIDVLGNPSEGVVEVELLGSKHDAVLEVIVEDGTITSMTTNVKYSFAENMKNAGLNTLLGMGTVFIVLILISLIISLFNFIPKLQSSFGKKKKTETEKSVEGAIAQIVESEELSDDSELVAVIAAAIASYEGTSSDDFVVRSIRKRMKRFA